MAIYRPKCRGEKPDDASYLHREMTISVFRHAAGGLAGALAALSASLTYAATLNQNLQTRPEAPPSLVAPFGTVSPPPARSRPVLTAEAKKPLPGIKSAEPPATAAEIVGKLLAPGASNPDVPLPHPDLSEKYSSRSELEGPLKRPTPFGRSETGGGVLGFRMPIPVERNGSSPATTSSPGGLTPEPLAGGASRLR
jgi:hypothetical protein